MYKKYFTGISFLGLCLLFSSCSDSKKEVNIMTKQEPAVNQADNTINNKVIISFFGAPGSGKGTLAEQLVEQYKYKTLSTGALFREHISKQTELGKQLDSFIKVGKLVPDDLVIDMVKDWLKSNADGSAPIILDGFPRTKEQADKLFTVIKTMLPDFTLRIVKIDLPEEEIVARLSGRRVCSNKQCQATYNISMPEIKSGTCPKCGSKLITREDDKPEVIRNRFKVYKENEKPILDFYNSINQKIETLNIAGLDKKQVLEEYLKLK